MNFTFLFTFSYSYQKNLRYLGSLHDYISIKRHWFNFSADTHCMFHTYVCLDVSIRQAVWGRRPQHPICCRMSPKQLLSKHIVLSRQGYIFSVIVDDGDGVDCCGEGNDEDVIKPQWYVGTKLQRFWKDMQDEMDTLLRKGSSNVAKLFD